MTQKLKTIIFATALTALAACSDDVATGRYSVGEEDNLVRLTTVVENAPSAAMQSRAALDGHYALQDGTAINLYVEGDWTRKTPSNIVKTPVYSAQKDTDADNNINALTWKSGDHLYWDDFGTADPDNTANRAKGLGILAVAIDGVTSKTDGINWKSFSLNWDVSTSSVIDEYLLQDIIVANNLYDASVTTPQKRYTFDEQKEADAAEARLEFQHVLSKVTFNVTAGQGFNGTFWDYPTIYLTRNKTGETADEWCYKNGKIDIKAATATHDGSTLGTVLLNPILRDGSIYTEAAIIYPGSDFGGNNDVIAKINADGNIYYVTAEKIRAAINGTTGHAGDYTTKPGYNYIFNITLNKTDIIVTATVSKWIDVNADEAFPKIVVSANVGNKGDTEQTLSDFRFYRNEGVNVPLFGSSDPVPTAPTTKNVKYTALADAKNPVADDKADGETAWKFWTIAATPTETSIYWPSHTTHYFFRGVYPKETTVADGESSYIVVNNAQYNASTFPSNLMIGAPEITDGTKCDNPDHTAVDMSKYGICARTGAINLNFRYMMSQVEVDLNTTTGDDKVNVAANTVVEIIGCYNAGNVFLGTREVKQTTKADYTLATVTGTGNELKRRSAIVPQPLKGLKFKVTVTNADGTKDVYYSTIKDIRVENETITEWKSGYHYKYTLTLKKTGISVTATITDWIPANGSDNVWM